MYFSSLSQEQIGDIFWIPAKEKYVVANTSNMQTPLILLPKLAIRKKIRQRHAKMRKIILKILAKERII